MNNVIINNPIPLLFLVNNILNSLNKVIIMLFIMKVSRLGKVQNLIGNITIPIVILIQLSEKFILVEGSKHENKLFIIVRFYYYLVF